MAQLKAYLITGMVIALITMGVVIKRQYDRNTELTLEVKTLTASIEKAQENLALVSDQLVQEQITRQIAEEALMELRDVPNEVYIQKLDPAVSSVLRNFRDRMQ